ncbi:hypothetical protein ACFPAF_11925 [Hymenobacter endophyticus]|uniref:Uncharacterized protein n=1 Tax=Hymenobacter endophyticus TaxID=3076335 RepID=A0ABU3TIB8_9BACT|nr:hypothetical protein [Hymenobacter endophyticus]MDU0371107.1 hypothetical protein [Hymenobacter endophyticus]
MKHLSGILHKLTAVAAVAVALTSCNRAEYAMLPKTSSAYHGTQRAATVAPAPVATETPVAAPATDVAPVAAPVEKSVAISAPAAKPAVAKTSAAPTAAVAKAPKLNFAQKAVVAKLTKQANKLAAKTQVSKKSEVASEEDATALSRNIKLGIILLLIGVLLGIFGGILGLLGAIIGVIGVVLIILGLLDEV